MYGINYETIEPLEVMQILKGNKDKERINKILELNIFSTRDGKLVIPSVKCIMQKAVNGGKDLKNIKNWFPFAHQVFWFELLSTKDLDFAISETKRILNGEKCYTFPNGTIVSMI